MAPNYQRARATATHNPGAEASPVTGEYDVAPFREAFERSGLSLTEVARRCGWTRPDQPRAGRALGYHRSCTRGRCYDGSAKLLTHQMATMLCEALGVDPVDVGM